MQDKFFPEGLPPSPLEQIAGAGLPVLLYGMGNGSEKAAALLSAAGIPLAGVFASEGFCRGKTFLGHTVFGAGELPARYPDGFLTLCAFGCPDGDMRMYLGRLRRMGGQVLLPHLPLFGGPFFDGALYEKHRAEIAAAHDLLADAESRRIYRTLLQYYLTWDPEVLFTCETNAALLPAALSGLSVRLLIDGGAYRGDSAAEFARLFPGLREIVAFEPDPVNFTHLSRLRLPGVHLTALPYGLWSESTTLSFSASHNRGSHFTPGHDALPVTAIDCVPECRNADLIKLDVEGCEAEALAGAEGLIRSRRPALLLSVYHKTEDFFRLPLAVSRLGAYRLHLLREPVCPAWDIRLLAVPL